MSDDSENDMDTDVFVNTARRLLRSTKKKMKQNLAPQQQAVVHNDVPKDVKILIPTSNRFDPLSDNDGEVRIRKPQPEVTSKARKNRVPPVIVPPPTTKLTVETTLKSISVADFRIKHASVGLYLYVDSIEQHKKIRETFKASGICYYSHDLPEDKVAKVVLIGLDKMDTSELSKLIKEAGFDPVEIKTITPKNSRYTDHINYLVYFKRDSTNLKELYKTKVINHTMIRWEPYRAFKSAPTQCRNCLRPGHGTRHCQMPARCMYCPGDHSSATCPAIKKAYDDSKAKGRLAGEENPQPKVIDDFKPTCCNCKGDHLATDAKCPEKFKFQEIQRDLSARNRQRPARSFQFNESDFPSTLQRRRPNHQAAAAQMSLNHRPTFSQVVNRTSSQTQPAANMHIYNGDCSESLFTFEEINTLIHEMMESLSKCKTKADQWTCSAIFQ